MDVRRPLALAALVPAFVVGASPAAAASHRAKPSCAAKKSVTVKSNRSVRVYRHGEELLGCLRRSGRDVRLYKPSNDGNPYVESGFSDVEVRGTVVAWRTSYAETSCTKVNLCPPAGREETVESTDLGTRRDVDRELRFNAEPTVYAVTTTGRLAALVGTTLFGSDGLGQRQRVLDSGAIDATSLRAEISVVSWNRDGVEHFARVR